MPPPAFFFNQSMAGRTQYSAQKSANHTKCIMGETNKTESTITKEISVKTTQPIVNHGILVNLLEKLRDNSHA